MPTLDCGSAALIFSVLFAFMIAFAIYWLLRKLFPNWKRLDDYFLALSWFFIATVMLLIFSMGIIHNIAAVTLMRMGYISGFLINILLGSILVIGVVCVIFFAIKDFRKHRECSS